MFGSKADWKRHEKSQHDDQQNWGSDFQGGHFQQVQTLINNAKQSESQSSLTEGLHFWCGFCRSNLPLRSREIEMAWNERFNHIDEVHFKMGQRTYEWQSKDLVEKQGLEAGIGAIYAGEEGVYESNGAFSYASSPVLDTDSPTTYNALKRKIMMGETPHSLSKPGESKRRHLGIDSSSNPGTEIVSCVRATVSSEPYIIQKLNKKQCQCRNGQGDVADCLFRPHTACDGCHGMEYSGSGCAWNNPSLFVP